MTTRRKPPKKPESFAASVGRVVAVVHCARRPALNGNRCEEPEMRIERWAAGQLASPVLRCTE